MKPQYCVDTYVRQRNINAWRKWRLAASCCLLAAFTALSASTLYAQQPSAAADTSANAGTTPDATPTATPPAAETPAPATAETKAPQTTAPAETTPAETAPADTAPAAADQASGQQTPSDFKSLDQDVQGLKKEVLDLNRELYDLEEDLLFPANTQIAVFVSMDVGTFFSLDTLTLKVDNKEVANYLYTDREAEALLKGGVQRVYLGNLKVGSHELVAFFTGKGPHTRDYKRATALNFEKGVGAKYLELKITDKKIKEQPEFVVKEWE